MRRLVLLTAIGVMAFTAVAYAVTNTLTYTATVSVKGKPSTKTPANMAYSSVLHIDTDPAGQQPDIGPTTTVFFAKGVKLNAKYFPFCNKDEIDGQAAFPVKCNKAVVGTGTATAYAGQPGQPRANSVKESLTVKVVNGSKGKSLYLVVNSTPDAPVAIQNRVIPGTIGSSSGLFAYSVRFDIPPDLQQQLGLSISLTDFSVKISSTAKKIKVSGKFIKAAYLQLTACKAHKLPVKAITQFKDTTGNLHPVTSQTAAKC